MEKWNEKVKFMSKDALQAAVTQAVQELSKGIPWEPKQTFYYVFCGKLTEREKKNEAFFGHFFFATIDPETFLQIKEQLEAFIHSKGSPTHTFVVPKKSEDADITKTR